jgi:hypothetical protein
MLAGQGNCSHVDRSHAKMMRPGFTADEYHQSAAMALWSTGLRR